MIDHSQRGLSRGYDGDQNGLAVHLDAVKPPNPLDDMRRDREALMALLDEVEHGLDDMRRSGEHGNLALRSLAGRVRVVCREKLAEMRGTLRMLDDGYDGQVDAWTL